MSVGPGLERTVRPLAAPLFVLVVVGACATPTTDPNAIGPMVTTTTGGVQGSGGGSITGGVGLGGKSIGTGGGSTGGSSTGGVSSGGTGGASGGSAGSNGTGGKTGSGGTKATGGTLGEDGGSGTSGGEPGSAGEPSPSGGEPGSAGEPGAGGVPGTAGEASSGGEGGVPFVDPDCHLTVEYTENRGKSADYPEFRFVITNQGDAFPLEDFEVRYYFNSEIAANLASGWNVMFSEQKFDGPYAMLTGSSAQVVENEDAPADNDSIIVMSFTSGETFSMGRILSMTVYAQPANYTATPDQSNDWSFVQSHTGAWNPPLATFSISGTTVCGSAPE